MTTEMDQIMAEVFPEPLSAYAVAREQRDIGMARSDAAQTEAWRVAADEFIYWYLTTHRTLFVDDLWDAGMPEPPGDRRGLGMRMRQAAERGWMEKSGESRPSVASRLGPKPVWTSLIYEGE